jgi:gliding motility-associated-like protein
MVTVQQLPFVTLRDTILNIGEIVSLDITDAGIASYVWTPNDNISCSNCPNPVFQPLQTTTYQVAVTDTSACFTMLYPIKINIIEKYSVDVPNAFTPNGDGINDRIFVKGWGIKEIVSFKIYNRMGQEVYSSSNLNEGWDGTFKGKSQPIETYSYNLQVRTFDEKVRNKSGTLKLLK